MKLDLVDPGSGRTVLLRQAHLGQICRMCPLGDRANALLPGDWIVNTDGDERGWTHLEHLQTRLMSVSARTETTP